MPSDAAEQQGAVTSDGLAPAPLETKGNDEFSSFLGGDGQSGASDKANVTKEQDPTQPPGTLKKAADPEKGNAAGKVSSQTGTAQPGAAAQQQTPPAQTAAGVDPKLISEIVEASLRGASASASKTSAAQQAKDAGNMSPEQFNEKYGIVQVTPAHVAAILDQDPKKAAAALNNILIANTRSAVLMAQDIVAAQLKAARAEYEPHVSSWKAYQERQVETARTESFYKTYPHLNEEKALVKDMTDALVARVQSGQIQFKSEQEAFAAVATATDGLLARMNKQAAAGGSPQSQQTSQSTGQTTPPPQRQMAAASTAGRSGTGQTAPKSDVEEVFGADAR